MISGSFVSQEDSSQKKSFSDLTSGTDPVRGRGRTQVEVTPQCAKPQNAKYELSRGV